MIFFLCFAFCHGKFGFDIKNELNPCTLLAAFYTYILGDVNDIKSQLMRLWYLSHRQSTKTQASLRIRAVSPEPSLFAQTHEIWK